MKSPASLLLPKMTRLRPKVSAYSSTLTLTAPLLLAPVVNVLLVTRAWLLLRIVLAPTVPARLTEKAEPVVAVASIWTDGDVRAALDVVGARAPGLDAYRVTERVRLDPRPVADGERADIVAQIALLRKPESMSREDYLAYWLLEHTAVAIRTQNTVSYIQNIVEEVLAGSSPPVAAIVEEHFPMASLTDPHELYGSGGDDAELERRMSLLIDSVVQFGAHKGLDLVPSSQYRWELAARPTA